MSDPSPNLPVYEVAGPLLDALARDHRVVLSAPTGSGKSTGLPGILLDSGLVEGQILVLEPRRLAARMLARRVAEMRGTPLGHEVGYQTRYETVAGPRTRIRFITAGILPRMLLRNPQIPFVGAVVFDEFHERSLDVDLGLGLVRRLTEGPRPDLIFAVMSATLAGDRLGTELACRCVRSDTRLFPVEIAYRAPRRGEEIWDAAAGAVAQLLQETDGGDILVFMPGVWEIERTMHAVRGLPDGRSVELFPLHGSLRPEAQDAAMRPGTRRRVIVSTNVAETSLTIPAVRHVVDSGLVRMERFDPGRGISMLGTEAVSRHSAEQRSGRAGRLGPGRCVRLWSIQHQSRKPTETDPEVRRCDLTGALLLLHALGVTEPARLPWIDPPAPRLLEQAKAVLTDLAAVRPDGTVTHLGKRLAAYPMHPRLARLMLAAEEHGCTGSAATAAAILGERPFLPTTRDPWRLLADRFHQPDEPASDLVLAIRALHTCREARFSPAVCHDLGVNPRAAREIARAAEHIRRQAPQSAHSGDSADSDAPEPLLRAFLTAFPDHLAVRRDRGTLACHLRQGRGATLARHSTVRHARILVAGVLREAGPADRRQTLLELVSEVQEEWLAELFPEQFERRVEVTWDDRAREARSHQVTRCLGLPLEQRPLTTVNREQESALLADFVARNREMLRGWNDDVEHWIARVRWLTTVFPERGFITYDDTDLTLIVGDICSGENRFAAVRSRDCLPYVQNALSWEDQEFVRTMAPERLRLPCGRRMRISYAPDRPPRGRARIQDLYDLEKTPRIAGGRVPLLIEILAPNHRAVQITDDLARFWKTLYPDLRRQLSRRYPKHEWR